MNEVISASDDLDRDVAVVLRTVEGRDVVVPMVALAGDNAREYAETGFRVAVSMASQRTALPTLNGEREIYVRPTVDCFIRTGNSIVVAAAGTPATGASHPVSAGERFTLRVPAGHTHIAYICEAGSGFVTVMPSA